MAQPGLGNTTPLTNALISFAFKGKGKKNEKKKSFHKKPTHGAEDGALPKLG